MRIAGDHDDRGARRGAELLQRVEARAVGQIEVEHGNVEVLPLERAQACVEARGVHDLGAAARGLGEAGLHQLGVVGIVLDQQDAQARFLAQPAQGQLGSYSHVGPSLRRPADPGYRGVP